MNAKHSVEIGSPEWLIEALNRFHRECQHRVFKIFAGPTGNWLLAGLSLLSAISLLFLHGRLLLLFAGTHLFLYQTAAYVLPIAISVLLLPFALFARSPSALGGGRILVFTASLAALLLLAPAAARIPLLVSLPLSFFIPLAGLALSLLLPAGRRLWPILAFTLIPSVFLGYLVARHRGDWRFLFYVLFSLPVMPLSWIAESSAVEPRAVRPFSFSFYAYYFSSLNLNYFLAVQSADLEIATEPKAIFLRGLGNLWTGLAILTTSLLFDQGGLLYAGGYGTYLFFFCATWGVLRMAVGIGQILGFPLVDPFYYPLLSADPVLHWKRWNVYFYRWYRTFVFFPVMRRANSAFLGMALIFVANYYFHTAQYLFVPLFLQSPIAPLRNFLLSSFYFFLSHAALIYICLVTPRYWPSGRLRRGWLGVLATNLAMILIHLVRS